MAGGRPVLRLGNDHDGALGGRVAPVRADAGVDEEAKVDCEDHAGDDGGADNLAPGGRILGRAVVVRDGVALAVGGGELAAVVVLVAVVQGDVCAEHAAGDAGNHPDDEAHADVGSGVDARLELSDCSGDDLGQTPYRGERGLYGQLVLQLEFIRRNIQQARQQ